MATSGSRPDQRKEKKPESVQFWLAITAGSLLFHSLFMFGVSRSIKVSVVEPAVSGAIDVEIVDPLGREVVAGGEPIVPAAAFKPEPTPLPEFSPEPTKEPTPEPSVKPEVKEKPPIADKPKPTKLKETPSTPNPDSPKSVVPVRSGNELPPTPPSSGGVRSVDVREESVPEQENSKGNMEGNDDPTSKLRLNPHPQLSISQSSPLFPVGKLATISVQFAAICPVSKGTVCDPTQVKIQRTKNNATYSGPAPNLSSKDLEEIDTLAAKIISQASVQSLTIETTTPEKPATFWSITFQIR